MGLALSPTQETVRFGLFELDLRAGQLTRNGMTIRLSQQPLRLLSVLLESPGDIVTREQLRQRLWPSDIYIDFDHGLNKSIQKLREALGDSADSPRYIETIPRVGYRFIAPVNPVNLAVSVHGIAPGNGTQSREELDSDAQDPPAKDPPVPSPVPAAGKRAGRYRWLIGCGVVLACVALGFAAFALFHAPHSPRRVSYMQLTDFTDSAAAPALSPDGNMVAFIRGGGSFLTSGQIYVKILPNGEARRVTDDNRPKYGLAFSPDGSQIAYTVFEHSRFSTYEVSALGGEPHLLLTNAAGLLWLDPEHLLYSEVRSGIHMGVVTSTVARAGLREIYFPEHERGMAHESLPSPDRHWALVVEMNGSGDWAPCRLIDLEGHVSSRQVGPEGGCTSAAWSPDGVWMYFTVAVNGQSHIWRQRFPDGAPEQITFGPTEEGGLAIEPGGKALITSVGVHESSLWIHDRKGDRSLSSEGEVADRSPVFSPDGTVIYYLLRKDGRAGAELQRTVIDSGTSEAVFPGVFMVAFDISHDGKQAVYATADKDGSTQLWLGPLDLSSPARKVGIPGARAPHFGPNGRILFQQVEGDANYLEQMNADGSHRSKVLSYPILDFRSVSPGGRWVIAALPSTSGKPLPSIEAIPLDGEAPRPICAEYCNSKWSSDGKFLVLSVQEPSNNSAGRSLAIPLGPGEALSALPAGGIEPLAEPGVVKGTQSVARAELVPGIDPGEYAWVNTSIHRNLYQITLP
jgi:DNA-binding winged helix-turn-helix (wHTH) protein/Tol biopolymer transport system component